MSEKKCVLTSVSGTPIFVFPGGRDGERIKGAVFDHSRLLWLAPAFVPFTKEVFEDIKQVFPDLKFSPKAEEWVEEAEDIRKKAISFSTEFRKDFEFVTKPYEHQEKALRFLLGMPRCGLFFDMGLGKTKIVVDLIRHENKKALVVAPTVAMGVWQNEIEKHARKLSSLKVEGTPSKKKKAILKATEEETDILLVSYDTAKRYVKELKQFPFKIIVADESHFLRGYKSQRTKALLKLTKGTPRRIILSGTPSLGNPLHLWGQLSFLAPFIPGRNFFKYRQMFCVLERKFFYNSSKAAHLIVGFRNLDILNEKVTNVSIRKKKEDCLDLPKRQIIDIPYSITKEQQKFYNEMLEFLEVFFESSRDSAEDDDPEKSLIISNPAIAIQKLMQVISGFVLLNPTNICDNCPKLNYCVKNSIKPGNKNCLIPAKQVEKRQIYRTKTNPKLEALAELIAGIIEEKRNKLIIWTFFREENRQIRELLQKENIGFIEISPKNVSKINEFEKEFENNEEKRIWLSNVSAGVSVTLTKAAYMIYYSLPLDLGSYLQAMDRNYRIGQKNKVVVYRMVCHGSITDNQIKALDQKLNLATAVVQKPNCVICPRGIECMVKGIEPFEDECSFAARMRKVSLKPSKMR